MKDKALRIIATATRILIGWHFLYEGIAKLLSPSWSAKGYLLGSKWIFSDFFEWMASDPSIIQIVDFLNIWGLILVGISLVLGFMARIAGFGGAFLLLFYFLAYPPIPGYTFGTVAEGSYLLVNKNLIEIAFLVLLGFIPVRWHWGIDRLNDIWREEKARMPVPQEETCWIYLCRHI